MDSTVCKFCQHKFYSSSNRHRHEVYCHKMAANQYGMGETYDSDHSDNDSDNEEPTETNSDSSQGEAEQQDHWEMLIAETCREMDIHKEIKNPKDIMTNPVLSEFLEELRQNLESKMDFAQYMQNEDKTYQELQNTAERFSRKDLDEDEAFEKAWNERKYLLKRLLRDNLDIVQKVLNEKVEDSDEEENEQMYSDQSE